MLLRRAHRLHSALSNLRTFATSADKFPPLRSHQDKALLVRELLAAKDDAGKTFSQIAAQCGWTNAFTAQLLHGQAQLPAGGAAALSRAVPGLRERHLEALSRPPLRTFDPAILQEPLVYRLYEAVGHYGEGLKALVNEEFGDGIMSAIDLYCTVGEVEGVSGERRVVITLNGKFLPHVEQRAADNTAAAAQAASRERGEGQGAAQK